MSDRIRRVRSDRRDLLNYYNITIAERRYTRLLDFYSEELDSLDRVAFASLSQQDRVDFLLLRNFLTRELGQLRLDRKNAKASLELLPFAHRIVQLCESRQDVHVMEGVKAAEALNNIKHEVCKAQEAVEQHRLLARKQAAYKAVKILDELRDHFRDYYQFYHAYDPLFDWWASTPWHEADAALASYSSLIETTLAGIQPGGKEEIVGEPIGRDGLMVELEAEMIPYTPEQLISHAQTTYKWCMGEMIAASKELGFGDNWSEALDFVKNQGVPPGQQTQLVQQLAREGTEFVQKHDLVTVPPISEETYRMFMMSAERQKESPFFLGGPSIIVSYPTAAMSHDFKKMVMRGNNIHFSRATAFHELIPGHRLQLYMGERHNSHRQMFSTPFFVEGWAMYWELLFWDMGNFFTTPEDRIGTLFWRMHRCARIIFSLKFHLGEMTAQECVDLLVNWVGHERSNAEAEVRRSFNGDYPPLYQVGYMIGALQIFQLRNEVLQGGFLGEKEFHDQVLRANTMPIELLRALILGLPLDPNYKSQWKFL
ncbi:hypothetical protein BGZ63DRAFT_416252 [Mariannaea sp. PMI_226]|nr:hypothetical protein BGZ63DRAFT_416252 [Mariannaea sp. PMI_226]